MIENLISSLEGLQQGHILPTDTEEALIWNGDQSVCDHSQIGEPLFSLFHPLLPFEVEGFRDNRHGQGPCFPCHFSDHRSAACPRPTSQSSSDEDHVCAFQHLTDLLDIFQGGLSSDLGIRTRPKPFC